MPQTKQELFKQLNHKLSGKQKSAAIPTRFGADSAVQDKREQRKLDAAAGLVPFACKLPSALATELAAQVSAAELNGFVAEAIAAKLKK
jgi:hypothetical protein